MSGAAVGVYHPGSSWLHRLSAGAKVTGLLVAVAALWWVDDIGPALAAVGLAVAVFASSRVPLASVARPARAVAVLLVLLGLVQWWVLGPQEAVLGCARLAVALVLAWTVSLTTRVADMASAAVAVLAAVLRVLRPLGADPARAERAGLTVALAVRSLPLLMDAARQANEARLARGHRLSVRSLAVPVVVRSLRIADALGDALVARGVGDGGGADDQAAGAAGRPRRARSRR